MFGVELGLWDGLMLASLLLAALAALAVVFTTFQALRAQKLETETARNALATYQLQAGVQMKTLELASDQLKKDTAEANARAASAELALSKIRLPRSFSADERDAAVAVLKPFAGTKFDTALANTPEAAMLLTTIEGILTDACWEQVPWKQDGAPIIYKRSNAPDSGLVTMRGVVIQMHDESRTALTPAAVALATALNGVGIDAQAEAGIAVGSTNTAAMHIMVGEKPI